NLVLALDDGLLKELMFYPKDIEDLYLKAIRFNPADYSNYLKLGLFYQKENSPKAEESLLKASKLYPTSFNIYLDLSKYYFEDNQSKKGFFNTMYCFHHAFRKGSFSALSQVSIQIQKAIAQLDDVYFISDKNAIAYIAYPESAEIDLRKEGFPRVQIPLLFEVHIKDPYAIPLLYRGNIEEAEFSLKEESEDFKVYEFLLKDFSLKNYLDDYKIRTDDASKIYRIDYIAFLEPVI
ncbi:MAG: hypothetical protein JW867_04060, partial [Candidatus Omnitrophica bacterium]|nr:hypothetical protein [Candidatus Omnitrophota bacterium]